MGIQFKRNEILVVCCFLLFVFCAAIFQLSSYDLWWHLAGGRFIVEGNGIPHVDPFSYTAQGVEWIDHEWLFQLVIFAVEHLAGATGLILLRANLIALIGFLIFRFVRSQGGLGAAPTAFLLIPFILAGRDRFLMRPELFTILFATLLMTTLLKQRDQLPGFRELWWAPALFALWANVHGGLIVGVAMFGLYGAGLLLQVLPVIGPSSKPKFKDIIPVAGVGLAAVAAGLVNPFGYHVYEVPFKLTALIESGIYNNLEWHHPGWPSQWLFYLMIVITGIVLVTRARRRDWPAILPLLFLGAISLQYVRNIALFSLLAPLFIVRLLRNRDDRERTVPLAGFHPAAASILLLLLGAWIVTAGYRFPAGLTIAHHRVPVGGVDFIEQHRPPGNLYNVYGFGGYVSWRLWPEVLTFIDGRNEVFVDIRKRLGESVADSRKWTKMLNDFGIGYALVSYAKVLEEVTLIDPAGGPPKVEYWPYTETHFPRRSWALVFWDDACMVYLRRTDQGQHLIKEHEIKHVFPSDANFQIEAFRKGWANPGDCVRELQARLSTDPGCTRAHKLLERVLQEVRVVR
uniref:Secreted protein n=1 Tax=uncultured sulfate-reducing bacterium TaxID=153939 RepID=Q3IBP9_9BACT|nr:secreted protein [uncultured sulfate-reducing bacterium]